MDKMKLIYLKSLANQKCSCKTDKEMAKRESCEYCNPCKSAKILNKITEIIEQGYQEVKPKFVCQWCGAEKENELGLCPKCCRFPVFNHI